MKLSNEDLGMETCRIIENDLCIINDIGHHCYKLHIAQMLFNLEI